MPVKRWAGPKFFFYGSRVLDSRIPRVFKTLVKVFFPKLIMNSSSHYKLQAIFHGLLRITDGLSFSVP